MDYSTETISNELHDEQYNEDWIGKTTCQRMIDGQLCGVELPGMNIQVGCCSACLEFVPRAKARFDGIWGPRSFDFGKIVRGSMTEKYMQTPMRNIVLPLGGHLEGDARDIFGRTVRLQQRPYMHVSAQSIPEKKVAQTIHHETAPVPIQPVQMPEQPKIITPKRRYPIRPTPIKLPEPDPMLACYGV